MNPYKRGKSSLPVGVFVLGVAIAAAIAPASALAAPAAVDQYTEQLPQGPGGTGRGQQVTTPHDGNALGGDQGDSPGSVAGAPGAGGGDPGAGSGPGATSGGGGSTAEGGNAASTGQGGSAGSGQGVGPAGSSAAASESVLESRSVDSKTLPLGDYPSSSFVTVLVALALTALLIAAGLGIWARFRQPGSLRG
jgi:hypothetical protein